MMKKLDLFIGIVALFAFLLLMGELSSLFPAYTGFFRAMNIAILFLFILDVLLRFFLTLDTIRTRH